MDHELSSINRSLSKFDRGRTPDQVLKARKLVCIRLDPRLTCPDSVSLTPGPGSACSDVAAVAQQWQLALQRVAEHFAQFDMMSPFLVPSSFSFSRPQEVLKATKFTTVSTNWKQLEASTAHKWQ